MLQPVITLIPERLFAGPQLPTYLLCDRLISPVRTASQGYLLAALAVSFTFLDPISCSTVLWCHRPGSPRGPMLDLRWTEWTGYLLFSFNCRVAYWLPLTLYLLFTDTSPLSICGSPAIGRFTLGPSTPLRHP